MKKVKTIGIIILVIIILMAISSIFVTVPTGFVGVKTRFGKAQEGHVEEGLNIQLPFIERIVRIDCRTKKIEATSEASTKDLQTVSTSIAVNYNVNKETATKLYREVGVEYESIIIAPAILEAIKSSMAQYTAEELITKRSDVSNEIQESLIEKIEDKGFTVSEFNITNIDFSPEYDQAIEAKAVKQQEVVAARAELEKQQIQNEKEISIAEKNAKVMELQNSQITENTLRLKKLEIMQGFIEKWNGILPDTMLSESADTFFDISN